MCGDPATKGREKGRGAAANPPNRFEARHIEIDPAEWVDADDLSPTATELIADHSRSLIATNDSPDVGFDASINPYRGCEHGCAYCYARPFHEYLGYSAGLDFETKILYKPDAPELLRKELASPKWVPRMLALSGVTDAYQPAERKLGLTRRCLRVLADFRNPVGIVTKGALVVRDTDILAELASFQAVTVCMSVTTLDRGLSRALEPRASLPEQRLRAIEALANCGIPVGVFVAPVIPGLNDHEIAGIIESAADAGARFASHILVRLPGAVSGLFEAWLETHTPERRDRVLNRLRAMRGGKLNDPRFGHRMRGDGPLAEAISALAENARRRFGLRRVPEPLATTHFRVPGAERQLSLFA